ncbi:hypothetical protein U9K52_10390 [Chryseobacterium sp. MHB01]|jgi:hypothetical protein|uniref:hypothetical protein n=1 Tax=Chryseobacterium sp. MHB01 TaxID=3109433 RepID=UPI002AFF43F1|nr:hypothetical protein [Chryseobacterium sp. MHB01]MEA1849322.1 hypothetical protein [Chryseobacterium sp. MHB01]
MKTFFCLLFLPIMFFGQLSPTVNKLYNLLSQSERYESKNISIDGHESEVYKINEKIKKIASDSEVEFIAFNGTPSTKLYAMSILFDRKSKSLEKLFRYYIKSKDSVQVMMGCVVQTNTIAHLLYQRVIAEKQIIHEADWERKWKDSMIANHQQNTSKYINLKDIMNTTSEWKTDEIDSLNWRLDKIILSNPESPKVMVEVLAGYHLLEGVKVPYFEKLAFFEKKYKSEYINKYLKFCRYGIKESID